MARCDNKLAPNRNCPPDPTSPYVNNCGGVASTIVVPELEIYSRRFIVDSRVNEFGVPFPPDIKVDTTCYPQGSFITMLFDECYDLDYYEVLYAEILDKLSWPAVVRRRLNVYPISAKYMEINNLTGRNLFNLQTDDLTLLDSLLEYRQDTTGLVVIDTTSITTTTLDTSGSIAILTTSLVSLSTELSQLIFVYLDLVINKSISNYNSNVPISTDYSLQTVYELFVVDKYFEYLSCLAIDVRLGARDPDYAGQPYDPSAGPPGSNPPGGESPEDCDPEIAPPNPSILRYGG
jgi:hypothetical protein